MKVTVVYELPEERDEFDLAMNASHVDGGIHEFKEWLRAEIKYNEHTEEEYNLLDKVRDRFFECIERN